MPVPKPKFAEAEVRKDNGKVKAASIAAPKQMPLPKPKVAEAGVKKDGGKGKAEAAKSAADPRAATAARPQAGDTQSRQRAAAPSTSVSASRVLRYVP